MYKCAICGNTGEKPVRRYDECRCGQYECRLCGSTEISRDRGICDICAGLLYEGERAYEAGDLLICRNCLTEVTV